MMWEASEKDLFADATPPRPRPPARDVTGELTADDLDQDRTPAPAHPRRVHRPGARPREPAPCSSRAARDRGESLDHVIFSGPSGPGQDHPRGQSSPNEMGAKMHTTSGPAIERAG